MNRDGYRNLDAVLGETGMALPVPAEDEQVEYVTVSSRVIPDSAGNTLLPFDSQVVLNQLAKSEMLGSREPKLTRLARVLTGNKRPDYCPVFEIIAVHPDEITLRDTNLSR